MEGESTDRLIPESTATPITFAPPPAKVVAMFLALRDITAAKGRFGLIAAVVGLITLLVVMLSGLTGGLGRQNTSALESLGADAFALHSSDGEYSFTSSLIHREDLAAWENTESVTSAAPLGTTQTTLTTTDERTSAVAVLGLPEGHELAHGITVPATGAVVSESVAADEDLNMGEDLRLGGSAVAVAGAAPDEFYSHSPVIWVSTDTWRDISHADDGVVGTAIALDGDIDPATGPAGGPDALSEREAFSALPAYDSEQGSLQMIQGFLYVISALVIVSFLTVWTIQRTPDLSVLRALGAAPRYLLKDALGQAAIVLALGAGLGAALGAGLGAAVAGDVPFQLDATTVAYPALGVFAVGLVGALFATRRVAQVDPLTALNAA